MQAILLMMNLILNGMPEFQLLALFHQAMHLIVTRITATQLQWKVCVAKRDAMSSSVVMFLIQRLVPAENGLPSSITAAKPKVH